MAAAGGRIYSGRSGKGSGKLPEDVHGRNVQLLVSDQKISGNVEKGWIQFTVSSILDHEVVVVT